MNRITTVIPVYNGERHLGVTLDSLAAQERRPDRVVVINDGSTDRTVEVATSHPAIRCEVRHNPRNLGLFPNHNRALELAAETEVFHLLHANDTLHPEFYARVAAPLEDAPVESVSYCGHRFIRDDGSPVGDAADDPTAAPRRVPADVFLAGQSELKSLQLHSMLIRTGCRPSPVSFPLDFPQLGDVIFHAHWGRRAPAIWHVPRPLVNMRLHEGSASSRNARNLQAFVTDEWRAMTEVSAMIDEPAPRRFLRRQKLSVLFAARTRVKLSMFREDPEYCARIRAALAERVNPLHRLLGDAAVFARDRLFPNSRPH